MAVEIPVQTPVALTDGPLAAGSAKLNFTAATLAGNQVALTGREMVLIRNDDAGAQTVTFTSVKDRIGRTGDISAYSIPATEEHLFGPFALEGWDSAGKLLFTCSDVDMKIAAIRIPYV